MKSNKGIEMAIGTVAMIALVLIVLVVVAGYFVGGFGEGGAGIQDILDVGETETQTNPLEFPEYTEECVARTAADDNAICSAHVDEPTCLGEANTNCLWITNYEVVPGV